MDLMNTFLFTGAQNRGYMAQAWVLRGTVRSMIELLPSTRQDIKYTLKVLAKIQELQSNNLRKHLFDA